MSISGGISKAVDNALHMGCSAFQIFSRNPKGWSANPLQQQEVENFKTKLKKCGIRRDCVCVHMPYLPNLSSPNKSLYEKSVKVLIEELRRCSALGIPYLVLHFGSNLGVGKESGVSQFVNACSLALENYASSSLSSESAVFSTSSSRKLPKRPKGTSEKEAEQKGFDKVTILLENNVGHKNTIGSRFEDIRLILDKLNSFQSLIGVCLDSCHAYAAGYDLGSKAAVESTLEKFDNIIGLKNLKLVHLNDSRDGLGSNLDRHENLGLGRIGNEGIGALCTYNSISSLPFIMETPREKHGEDMITIRRIVNKLQT